MLKTLNNDDGLTQHPKMSKSYVKHRQFTEDYDIMNKEILDRARETIPAHLQETTDNCHHTAIPKNEV